MGQPRRRKTQKEHTLFFRAIIQIKHRLLRENVCQTTMPQREREREREGKKKKEKPPLEPNEGILLDHSLHTVNFQ